MTSAPQRPLDARNVREKYGPWAVIAGGSDGTGEAFARELAACGVNIMLVARRAEALEALAADLRADYGVETRTLVQDLMTVDAAQNVLNASADLDVGVYISNAGADGSGGALFFDAPATQWRRVVNLNVVTVTEAVHGFGARFLTRGRGGIVVMSTGAALGGRPGLSMYAATKGFEMMLVEALWGELEGKNVDVLCVLAPAMDTPNFRRAVTGKALDDMKAANLIRAPQEIAREALAQLGRKPLILFQAGGGESPDEIVDARLRKLQQAIDVHKSYAPKD